MLRTRLAGVADPSTYRPAPGTIPEPPGVYRFRDGTGRVIYVGKAKNLRSRLNSYFADVWTLHAAHPADGHHRRSRWTGSPSAPRSRRCSWSSPGSRSTTRGSTSGTATTSRTRYLAVTLDEEYPRLQVMRGAKRKGVRYFGPYSHAWAIRETLDLLLRVFPARTCSAGVFKRAGQIGRPCLLGYIGKCSAPCVGTGHRRRAPGDRRRTSATSWPGAPTPWSASSSAR